MFFKKFLATLFVSGTLSFTYDLGIFCLPSIVFTVYIKFFFNFFALIRAKFLVSLIILCFLFH